MAYLVEITNGCAYPFCPKPSTVRVFNNQNARMADYCRRHGVARVRELSRIEADMAKQPAPTEAA